MDALFPILIAVVIVAAVIVVLISVTSRKGKYDANRAGHKKKGRNQIIKEATKKLSVNPHNTSGLIPLADLYYSEQAWDKAYPLYDTMLNIASAHADIDLFTAALRQGICALKLKKTQEAFRGLIAAYSNKPQDFEVNYYLGQACYESKQYDKAVPCLKKALALNPEAEGVCGALGESLYHGNHFKESLPYLKRALDENPENKEILYTFADSMLEAGYGDKALKVFMHLRPDPEYGAKSCLAAGTMHVKMGMHDKAIQDFEIGLKHVDAPSEVLMDIRYRMAQSCFATNQISKGLSYLTTIQNVLPNYKDVPALIQRYQELSQNSNLQVYLSAGNSDFVALCRKIVTVIYTNAFVKVVDLQVDPTFTEVLCEVETSKWEDTEIFRFYRTVGSTGELYIRDFHGRIHDAKADRGICVTAGSFSEEARKFTEGRPIDLIEKAQLIKLLKKVDMVGT